jgi:LPS-assembly protein
MLAKAYLRVRERLQRRGHGAIGVATTQKRGNGQAQQANGAGRRGDVARLKLIPLAGLKILMLAPGMMLASGAAHAQALNDRATPVPTSAGVPRPATDQEIAFSAAALDYDESADIVTATGDVRMVRAGNRLRADKVTWNRKTGAVIAEANVAVANPGGDTAYGDRVALSDTLRDGVIDNLLLVLEDGGRLAAEKARRADGITTLDRAAYSPCAVINPDGCPKNPTWKITAVRVVHNPDKNRIFYRGARLNLFGAPLIWLPGLSHPDGSGAGGSGLLVPDIRYTRANGVELALPYYVALAPNRDIMITPHIYSDVLPAIEAQYRALAATGAYQVAGMITYGSRLPASISPSAPSNRRIRGYLDASGRFQLDPLWSISGSGRVTSDRTFLRRYDITNDDRLRSTINLERVDRDSYLSIAGWAVQTLRVDAEQGQQPIALPVIDYRRRLTDPLVGGRIELQANTLAILRTAGQDTQRAFAGARWDLRRFTPLGQEVVLTAYGRGDVYHTDNILATVTPSYRGREGWSTRGIGALAADLRWPFIGSLFGGSQQIVPRVQIVASGATANLSIPNEDARSVDLEDSNLFALNRFAGYDRWEDGARITYGFIWSYARPRFSVRTIMGQSHRLSTKTTILPDGTGLSGRTSDIVGRTTIRYGDFVAFTHRFRLDKHSLSVRRNEIDTTIGTRRTYATVGYLRLNRNIASTIEDLRDREELRLGGRVQIARYWSLFGSTVIDLTDRRDDPLSLSDGYEPVRHRLGVLYDDDCIEVGVTWRRDYDQVGDARRGNTYLFRLALKNLGR